MQIKIRDEGNVVILDILGDFTLAFLSDVRLDRVIKDKVESGEKNFLLNLKLTTPPKSM